LAPRLPVDRPRPATLSGRGALHRSTLPAEVADGISSLAAELGSTPHAVLATTFATWLGQVCGQPDIVVATNSANRTKPEHEGVVGLIGDSVLVRVRLRDTGFGELAHAFSASLFAALDHQDLPLGEVISLVAPDFSGPRLPVLFTVVTTPPPRLDLEGVESNVCEIVTPGQARTELYVRIAAEPHGVQIFWEYSTDLFTEQTITTWDADLRALLEGLLGQAGDAWVRCGRSDPSPA
jgi:non-ribosomal peptide synthetase component F